MELVISRKMHFYNASWVDYAFLQLPSVVSCAISQNVYFCAYKF